jgi:hypothetical protein
MDEVDKDDDIDGNCQGLLNSRDHLVIETTEYYVDMVRNNRLLPKNRTWCPESTCKRKGLGLTRIVALTVSYIRSRNVFAQRAQVQQSYDNQKTVEWSTLERDKYVMSIV